MNQNSVIFKCISDGLIVILDETTEFENLKNTFLNKVIQTKDFFEDANISITFKGRELSEDEEMELLKIISKESGLQISFVNDTTTFTSQNESQKKDDNQELNLNTPILTAKNNIVYYHKGSLRSGQRIDFAGSVVIIGDVNPGAEIMAEGNIIILGKLKGSAHAGCKGADDCFISALQVDPVQIIIKDVIAFFPEDIDKKRGPEYIYIKDGQIFVEPLSN